MKQNKTEDIVITCDTCEQGYTSKCLHCVNGEWRSPSQLPESGKPLLVLLKGIRRPIKAVYYLCQWDVLEDEPDEYIGLQILGWMPDDSQTGVYYEYY